MGVVGGQVGVGRLFGQRLPVSGGGGGGSTVTYLPTITNTLHALWSPFKLVEGYSGPTVKACATAAADTPASSIDVSVDPATGNPDYSAAIAAYGADFDIFQGYDQTGAGNHWVAPTASKRFTIRAANAWGALQPLTSKATGSFGLIPDTLVTSRQSVSMISVSAQRGAQKSSAALTLNNTNATPTYLNMLSDWSGVQAVGNAFLRGTKLGLVTPTIKAVCSGASNTKVHRNDEVESLAASTASASMAGGGIGAIKTGATTASTTGQSAFEDRFCDMVYSGQVSDADMVTVKTYLKARFSVPTGHTWQLICFGDSIMWGQASSSGVGWPSRILPYLPSNVELSNPSTAGLTLSTLITDWNNFTGNRVDSSMAKKFVVSNGGTNDLGASATSATVLERQQTLAAAIVAKGAVPIFLTIPARDDSPWTTTKETERLAYNVGLLDLTNQSTYGYKVIDRAANPDLQTPTNLTFFNADKLHLTDAGYQSAADYEQAALNAIMAAA